MIPQQGQLFKLATHPRFVYRCLEVRDDDVLAYGGSTNPWGRKWTRSFRKDAPFRLFAQSRVNRTEQERQP